MSRLYVECEGILFWPIPVEYISVVQSVDYLVRLASRILMQSVGRLGMFQEKLFRTVKRCNHFL